MLRPLPFALALVGGLAVSTPVRAQDTSAVPAYQPVAAGSRLLTRGGIGIRVLVDSTILGGSELEVGELTLPPAGGAPPRHHRHGAIELLYILSGVLDHVVNGRPHRLGPGMMGIVRPGDSVAHQVVSPEPLRALVIWVPAGELARIEPGFQLGPLPPRSPDGAEGPARLREAWIRGYEAGSVEALADLYTSEAVRMPYDTPAQHGREAVLSAYARSFAARAFDPSISLTPAERKALGDEVLERGSYREILRARQGSQVLIEEGTYVSLVRRGEDGTWRFVWSMFNRDAPARPSGR